MLVRDGEHGFKVGRVQLHFEIVDETRSLLSLFTLRQHVGGSALAVRQVCDDVEVLETEQNLAAVEYCVHSSGNVGTTPPIEFRSFAKHVKTCYMVCIRTTSPPHGAMHSNTGGYICACFSRKI